jgi:hypothetical protein
MAELVNEVGAISKRDMDEEQIAVREEWFNTGVIQARTQREEPVDSSVDPGTEPGLKDGPVARISEQIVAQKKAKEDQERYLKHANKPLIWRVLVSGSDVTGAEAQS